MPGRSLRYGLITLAILAVLSFYLPQGPSQSAQAASDADYSSMRLLTEVMEQIQKRYVEKKTPTNCSPKRSRAWSAAWTPIRTT